MRTGIYNFGQYKVWYVNDIIHRSQGPAVIYSDGTKIWYKNGSIHRWNGPAIIDKVYNIEEWWIFDKNITPWMKELEWTNLNSIYRKTLAIMRWK